MKCFFRSFDVGIGDCCVIRLVDNDLQYVIMVDCGIYTPKVQQYLENTLNYHIDLLIATHIDGDHINGLIQMLKEPNLKIDNILYNVYHRSGTPPKLEITNQQKNIVDQLRTMLPAEFDSLNYKPISAKQGKTLAEMILENEEYNNAWVRDWITKDSPDFLLPNDLGKIVFLGPSQDSLKKIDSLFKDEFNKYFMQCWEERIDNVELLQELLIKIANESNDVNPAFHHQVSYTRTKVVDFNYIEEKANEESTDKSISNLSSIAFMLEIGKHKILMLGDSFPRTIVSSLDQKYARVEKPIHCDAIKISHHGSNNNTSNLLLERATSHKYFIPGGRGNEYPSWGVLGKISLNNHEIKKKIIYSHNGNMVSDFLKLSKEVVDRLNVEIINCDDEYELFD